MNVLCLSTWFACAHPGLISNARMRGLCCGRTGVSPGQVFRRGHGSATISPADLASGKPLTGRFLLVAKRSAAFTSKGIGLSRSTSGRQTILARILMGRLRAQAWGNWGRHRVLTGPSALHRLVRSQAQGEPSRLLSFSGEGPACQRHPRPTLLGASLPCSPRSEFSIVIPA